MTEPKAGPREIRDENGDLLFRVTEENPGTVLRALRCEGPAESRQVIDYPERWYALSDRQLHRLCRSGERVDSEPH
jgi:hypothetical protein